MPTTRIEIEELELSRWVAEVELGGLSARRVNVAANSFYDLMNSIAQVFYENRPEANPKFGQEPKVKASAEPKPSAPAEPKPSAQTLKI